MKKIILILFGLSIVLSSCKEDVDALFLNPDAATDAKIEYLFTGAITEVGAHLRTGYNPSGYYLILEGIGPWTQVVANNENDSNMMKLPSNAISGSWNAFYKDFMSKIAEIEILYEGLSPDEQADYEIYLVLSKVLKAHAASKTTDLYGDIPYSEAFSSRKVPQIIFPKFDSQKDLYTSVLADLKEAAAFLSSFSYNGSKVHNSLMVQDLLNYGDIDKWLRFTNSLRLRIALRISDADAALASTTVSEVQNSPLVLTNDQNILFEIRGSDRLNTRTGEGGGHFIARAFNDRPDRTYAGQVMVEEMNAANDPRRPYYFTTNLNGDYVGVPSSPDLIAPISNDINEDNYSKINNELILDNLRLPGIAITASEVNFLLAEAAMKGLGSGVAKDYYDTALRQSVEFYYLMVKTNPEASPAAPNTADVNNLVNNSTFTYNGTIQQLAMQKWIHLGVLQVNEVYADYRRLDFNFLQVNTPEGGGAPLEVPTRITIPDAEKTRNEENYLAVKPNDTPYSKVWWDKN